jgi:hypothetical protein
VTESNNSLSAPFKDRKVGLVIFGMATILIGLFCALLVPLMFFGASMAAKSDHPPPPPNLWAPSIIYSGLAVTFIFLGAGSIMTKRWARALLAILSWIWLVFGLLAVGVMVVMIPGMMKSMEAVQPPGQQSLPESAKTVVLVTMLVIEVLIFVGMPLVWALFYSSKNVKATCEARDPVVRWTDRCPLPVLVLVLFAAFSALMLLIVPWSWRVALFFGAIISGPLAVIFYLMMACVFGYAALACYRLDRRGWWIYLTVTVILFGSTIITYWRHSLSDIYSAMGYSPEQLAQLRPLIAPISGATNWTTLVFFIPFLGYLIYVRRFFPDRTRETPVANS